MPAIITDKLKRTFSQLIFDENQGTTLGDSNNYFYIGVGHSQIWQTDDNTDVTPTPANSERDRRLFRYNLQSVKAVEAFSFVVPLTDWTTNTIYPAYNDAIVGQPTPSYYVRTADNNVYVCIRQGKDSFGAAVVSQTQPDHTNTSLPIETDGYVWKYMYTITTADANKFLTSNFMPVKFVDSAAPTAPEAPQKAVQDASVVGQIIGYRVDAGNAVYSSAPTLTVRGDGSGAKAHGILDAANKLAAVEIGDSAQVGTTGFPSINSQMGSGFNQAYVKVDQTNLTSGTNAKVYPIIAPDNGIGADMRTDLRSNSIMFNIKPEGSVDGTWVVDNEYRQIGLLKNLLDSSNGNLFTETQGTAAKKLVMTTRITGGLNWADDVTVNGESDASAWIDYFDDSATIWYHQDEETGFVPFRAGETVTISGKTGSFTVDTIEARDIDIFSGELLFLNNQAKIARDADQTEDIKVVIKL